MAAPSLLKVRLITQPAPCEFCWAIAVSIWVPSRKTGPSTYFSVPSCLQATSGRVGSSYPRSGSCAAQSSAPSAGLLDGRVGALPGLPGLRDGRRQGGVGRGRRGRLRLGGHRCRGGRLARPLDGGIGRRRGRGGRRRGGRGRRGQRGLHGERRERPLDRRARVGRPLGLGRVRGLGRGAALVGGHRGGGAANRARPDRCPPIPGRRAMPALRAAEIGPPITSRKRSCAVWPSERACSPSWPGTVIVRLVPSSTTSAPLTPSPLTRSSMICWACTSCSRGGSAPVSVRATSVTRVPPCRSMPSLGAARPSPVRNTSA